MRLARMIELIEYRSLGLEVISLLQQLIHYYIILYFDLKWMSIRFFLKKLCQSKSSIVVVFLVDSIILGEIKWNS